MKEGPLIEFSSLEDWHLIEHFCACSLMCKATDNSKWLFDHAQWYNTTSLHGLWGFLTSSSGPWQLGAIVGAHFTDEETETERGRVTYPRPVASEGQSQDSGPDSDSRTPAHSMLPPRTYLLALLLLMGEGDASLSSSHDLYWMPYLPRQALLFYSILYDNK